MNLNDVYVTWKDGEVEVVPKSKGVPCDVDDFFDPTLWDQSNIGELFLLWFSTLTIGFWSIRPMKCRSQVWEALSDIDEFDELDGKALHKRYRAGFHPPYRGDMYFSFRRQHALR